MKAYHNVIVKLDKPIYNDKHGSLFIDVNKDDMQYVNKEVEVISAPDYTKLKEGDKIIIHHNIIRQRIDIKGNIIESNYFIKDNIYACPLTEIYLHKPKNDSEWRTYDPYVFIKPIEYVKTENKFGIIIPDSALEGDNTYYKGQSKERGTIRYINEELKSMGLKEGDTVIFAKDSEFEFKVEGELLYKMSTNDIIAKIE